MLKLLDANMKSSLVFVLLISCFVSFAFSFSVYEQWGRSQFQDSFTYNQTCDVRANCTYNQICLNGLCKCLPNFGLINGRCQPLSCLDKNDVCSEQDANRECNTFFLSGRCVCRQGYIEDPITKACRKTCIESDHSYCETDDGLNAICNVYRCQCKPNHRRDPQSGLCVPFECQSDAQCWSDGDYFRTCTNSTCTCAYEIDPYTQRCMLRMSSILNIRYYQSWRSERILLATIIFVPIVFYYCAYQNFRKARSTIVYLKNPSPGQTFYSHQSTLAKKTPEKCSPLEGSGAVKYERFS